MLTMLKVIPLSHFPTSAQTVATFFKQYSNLPHSLSPSLTNAPVSVMSDELLALCFTARIVFFKYPGFSQKAPFFHNNICIHWLDFWLYSMSHKSVSLGNYLFKNKYYDKRSNWRPCTSRHLCISWIQSSLVWVGAIVHLKWKENYYISCEEKCLWIQTFGTPSIQKNCTQ